MAQMVEHLSSKWPWVLTPVLPKKKVKGKGKETKQPNFSVKDWIVYQNDIDILTLGTYDCNLIWKQPVLMYQVKMRSLVWTHVLLDRVFVRWK
jgi:hypothetical protein